MGELRMAEPSDGNPIIPSTRTRPSVLNIALQLYVVLGGAISLLGWVLDIPRFTDWLGNGISIQPNTTVAVITAGTALAFLSRGYHQAYRVLGLLLITIGGSVLAQIATGVNLGIDTLLMFDREWGRVGVLSPGRMGPAGATCWTLLGIAFVLASFARSKARRLALGIPMLTASISLLSLVGYLYGASRLYSLPHTTVIALQTATFIFAVSLGVMLSIPKHGLMPMLADPHSGGVFARRMLPAILFVPLVLGFLELTGERLGLHDTAFGSALRTVLEIIFFMLFVWIISAALTGHAKRRVEVAEALRVSRQELRAELADLRHLQLLSTELIVEKNPERLYESVLDAAVQLMRADFASIQMLYPARGELRLLAYRGFTPEAASFWTWVRADSECTCGMALRDGKRVIVSDTETDDSMNGTEHQASYRQTGIRAVQSTPLLSRTGEIVGMISTHWRAPHEPLERELRLIDILARQAADLIERHRAEQEREALLESERAARTSAEHAARLKDDFLATLSHELRTPLHAVIGWAQILKKDLLEPDKARAAAEVIERNARLQAQLITDLLDISRIVSGNMRLDLQAVDLPAVLEAAVESVMPAAHVKGIRIEKAIQPIGHSIQGDPARLQQVVWNLLSNAVKFTPSGGTVRLALTHQDSLAEIRVEDTGQGIAPEFLPHVFQRFRQADPTPSRSHGGLGIGLAIVKQLVELHGGSIRVTSDGIGKGATFAIVLPLRVSHREPLDTPPPGKDIEPSRALVGVRVLVIDDEADALAMMRRILEDQGARVETCLSADGGLDLLGAQVFDALVSDIGMPGRDGFDFIATVRNRGITIPALALTAFARDEDRAKVLRSGYQAHASKPVDAAEFLATLSSLIHSPGAAEAVPMGTSSYETRFGMGAKQADDNIVSW